MGNINLNTEITVKTIPSGKSWDLSEEFRYTKYKFKGVVGSLEEFMSEYESWYNCHNFWDSSPLKVLSGYWTGRSDCLDKCLHEPRHLSEKRWVEARPNLLDWDSERKAWKEGSEMSLLRANLIK